MSCEYCSDNKAIFEIDIIDRTSWGWGGPVKITLDEADEYKHAIFIDRGFIRSVPKDDCSCMDHGEKVAVNFCPFCGEKLKGITP